jgi:hypothetical protein
MWTLSGTIPTCSRTTATEDFERTFAMTTKAKARVAPKAAVKPSAKPTAAVVPLTDPWLTPPGSMEERLDRIQVLGDRIEGHVKFMRGVGKLNGTSMESKQKAVLQFYERLYLLEQELAQIQENLCLG